VKSLFDDEALSFESLRVTGYAPYGGADLGEVLVTARQIPDGDEAAWHQCWIGPTSTPGASRSWVPASAATLPPAPPPAAHIAGLARPESGDRVPACRGQGRRPY
jgi:hypothetical protein